MNADLMQQIRERAYQLWTMRPDSNEVDNWLAAEREIRRRQATAVQSAGTALAGKKTRVARRKPH